MVIIEKGDKLYLTHDSNSGDLQGLYRLDEPLEKVVRFISPGIFAEDSLIYFEGGGGISEKLIGRYAFITREEAEEALSIYEEFMERYLIRLNEALVSYEPVPSEKEGKTHEAYNIERFVANYAPRPFDGMTNAQKAAAMEHIFKHFETILGNEGHGTHPRGRITRRMADGTAYIVREADTDGVWRLTVEGMIPEVISRLAYYEDLEENARTAKIEDQKGERG